MCSFPTLLVTLAALGAQPRGMVLEFSATWCGPCQQMSPIVAKLEREGLPIRKVDVDQNRPFAEKHGVTHMPTFILVVDGKEVTRQVGAMSESDLRRMLARIPAAAPEYAAQAAPGAAPPAAPQNSHQPAAADVAPNAPRSAPPAAPQNPPLADLGATAPFPRALPADESEPARAPQTEDKPGTLLDRILHRDRGDEITIARGNDDTTSANAAPNILNPLAASVRLRVTINGRVNLGSGTVVESRPGRTLLISCGHIFRGLEDDPKAKIEVDLFPGSQPQTYVGRAVKYDLDADVGLVAIRTDSAAAVALIGGPQHAPLVGEAVSGVGCSGGDIPTREQLQITALNKYDGPDNIECTGIPVRGRSGGGLFNASAELIGVCIAADPKTQHGLYAGLLAIHNLLDQCDLAYLYKPQPAPQSMVAATSPASEPRRDDPFTRAFPDSAAPPPRYASAPAASSAAPANSVITYPAPAAAVPAVAATPTAMPPTDVAAGDAEVVVIIRDRNNPEGDHIVIINRASLKFRAFLNAELAGTSPQAVEDHASSRGGVRDPRANPALSGDRAFELGANTPTRDPLPQTARRPCKADLYATSLSQQLPLTRYTRSADAR